MIYGKLAQSDGAINAFVRAEGAPAPLSCVPGGHRAIVNLDAQQVRPIRKRRHALN